MNYKLHTLPKTLKSFLITYLIVLTIGLSVGLVYLYYTTNLTPKGATERFRGSEEEFNEDEIEIQESYPKPISEMLLTTHNHILGMSFIFLTIGLIFYFNSIVEGFWKKFLMIEPLISVVVSFGSIWLVRFVSKDWIILTVLSATLMYLSFYVVVGISLFELLFKKIK